MRASRADGLTGANGRLPRTGDCPYDGRHVGDTSRCGAEAVWRYSLAVDRPQAEHLAPLPLFRRVMAVDRAAVAAASTYRDYIRGDSLFDEGDAATHFFVVLTGRVKVFKRASSGQDRILEMFGAGGLLGAVAVYEQRPYPAAAEAMEATRCLVTPSDAMFALLEERPTLVRGLLGSLSIRLIELTSRLTDLTAGRIEARLARLFLKLADQLGRPDRGGVFIPLVLSRQELADLTGTTIETTIRIMSRWNKEAILRTEKDGFVLLRRDAFAQLGD